MYLTRFLKRTVSTEDIISPTSILPTKDATFTIIVQYFFAFTIDSERLFNLFHISEASL